jgi:hypothetical protein
MILKAVPAAGDTFSMFRLRHIFLNITLHTGLNSLRPFYVAHMPPCKGLFAVGMTLAALAFASPSLAEHYHPLQDEDIHEKFYSTWRRPDNSDASCCSNRDCYPTEVRTVGGEIFAKRREDGKFIAGPAARVDRKRDNPDGRNHICAPPPTSMYMPDTVFCFMLGTGM